MELYIILRREVQIHPEVDCIHVKTKWVDMAFSKEQAANICLERNKGENPRVRENEHGWQSAICYYYLAPDQQNNIDIVSDFEDPE